MRICQEYIIKASSFKFGQIQVTFKYNDILLIKTQVLLSDRMQCNNEKDWWYIVGYPVDEVRSYHCLSRHQRTYLVMTHHNTTRTYLILLFNISEAQECVLQCRKFLNDVESQLFEKLKTEPIKEKANTCMICWKRGRTYQY